MADGAAVLDEFNFELKDYTKVHASVMDYRDGMFGVVYEYDEGYGNFQQGPFPSLEEAHAAVVRFANEHTNREYLEFKYIEQDIERVSSEALKRESAPREQAGNEKGFEMEEVQEVQEMPVEAKEKETQWVNMRFNKAFVHPMKSAAGEEFLKIRIPPNTKVDGEDLQGWTYTPTKGVSTFDNGTELAIGFPMPSWEITLKKSYLDESGKWAEKTKIVSAAALKEGLAESRKEWRKAHPRVHTEQKRVDAGARSVGYILTVFLVENADKDMSDADILANGYIQAKWNAAIAENLKSLDLTEDMDEKTMLEDLQQGRYQRYQAPLVAASVVHSEPKEKLIMMAKTYDLIEEVKAVNIEAETVKQNRRIADLVESMAYGIAEDKKEALNEGVERARQSLKPVTAETLCKWCGLQTAWSDIRAAKRAQDQSVTKDAVLR